MAGWSRGDMNGYQEQTCIDRRSYPEDDVVPALFVDYVVEGVYANSVMISLAVMAP